MKLTIWGCTECYRINSEPNFDPIDIELNDEFLYRSTCKNGHVTYTCIQNHKYEFLFELGLHALVDGHPDSACSKFSTTCERFYEFAAAVLSMQYGIDPEAFYKLWKKFDNNSQAQLGAFRTLYHLEMTKIKAIDELSVLVDGKQPFDPERIKFRNKVTHKGYIPSTQEAYDYGSMAYEFISRLLSYLKSEHEEGIRKVTSWRLFQIQRNVNESEITFTTMYVPTAITSVQVLPDQKVNFNDLVSGIKKKSYVLKK